MDKSMPSCASQSAGCVMLMVSASSPKRGSNSVVGCQLPKSTLLCDSRT